MVTPRPYSRHSTGPAWGNSHLQPDSCPDPHPGPGPHRAARPGSQGGWTGAPPRTPKLPPGFSPGGAGSGKPGGEGQGPRLGHSRREAPQGSSRSGVGESPRRRPGRGRPRRPQHSPDAARPRGRRAARALAEAPSPPGAPSSGQAEEGESALPGTSSRDAPPPQPPGPEYLPLRRLQLRGQCRRLRLTRGAPPRPPSAPRRGGAGPAGGGTGRGGRPLAPPAHSPARGMAACPGCGRGSGVGSLAGPGSGRRAGPLEDSASAPPSSPQGRTGVGKVVRRSGWGRERAAAALPWPTGHPRPQPLGPSARGLRKTPAPPPLVKPCRVSTAQHHAPALGTFQIL